MYCFSFHYSSDALQKGFTQKYFKAMYDYNPVEQSLNDEGMEEELAFVEGDVIMVSGWASNIGREGGIPGRTI